MPAPSSLRPIGLLSICSLGQMLIQFAFQVLLARLFGASDQMDAYNAALTLPAVITTVIAATLPAVLIPAIIHRREADGHDPARQTASLVGLLLAAGLAALCLVAQFFDRPLMALVQPGFDAEQVERAAHIFRTLVWLIWTQSFTAFLQAVAHVDRRFLVPALAPLAGSTFAIIWAWIGYRQQGIDAVSAGVVGGSLLTVCLQLQTFIRYWKLPAEWDPGTARVCAVVWPFLLAVFYCKLDPVVDLYFASQLPSGSVSHLNYAVRIIGTLMALSTSGLAVVVFPVLTQHAATGQEQEMRAEVIRAFRFLIFALTPIATGLVLFHRPVIRDFLQRGEFAAQDTEAVGALVAILVGLLLGGSAGEILARTSFALRDTRTPLMVGMAGFTVGAVLKWRLVDVLGLNGLALATSAYYLLNAFVQFWLLSRRLGSLVPADVISAIGRAALGSAGAAAVAFAVLQLDFPFVTMAGAAGAAVVYLGLTGWAGDEFARSLIRFVWSSEKPRCQTDDEHR